MAVYRPMALKFGTSGVRGLETELTDAECIRFARAFIQRYRDVRGAADGTSDLCIIAGDLRRSTPRMLEAIAQGLALEGFGVLDAGIVPTPALAFECATRGLPGIMVTGSHIPADRNGIKFYYPWGEILKEDEAPILSYAAAIAPKSETEKTPRKNIPSEKAFIDRYVSFFGSQALAGRKIVFYEHSSAAREAYPQILESLGAKVVRIDRSETFVPVDTEALENVQSLGAQVLKHKADALISTDGDGDRPLLLDEKGQVVRGDQIGVLAAQALRADSVSTPVSSSTALEAANVCSNLRRCKIGSPFVIAAMNEALGEGARRVVGYEANGGFLLGSNITEEGRDISALPTRDSVLPVLLLLATPKGSKPQPLSKIVAALPARFTDSDLIREFPLEKSRAVLEKLSRGGITYFTAEWKKRLGSAAHAIDETDGVRVTFESQEILHFRPSGNAPEFRIYSEASTESRARELREWAKEWVGRF